MPFLDVRDPKGRLLFRFDPVRDLIDIQRRSGRERATVRLSDYRAMPPAPDPEHPTPYAQRPTPDAQRQ